MSKVGTDTWGQLWQQLLTTAGVLSAELNYPIQYVLDLHPLETRIDHVQYQLLNMVKIIRANPQAWDEHNCFRSGTVRADIFYELNAVASRRRALIENPIKHSIEEIREAFWPGTFWEQHEEDPALFTRLMNAYDIQTIIFSLSAWLTNPTWLTVHGSDRAEAQVETAAANLLNFFIPVQNLVSDGSYA